MILMLVNYAWGKPDDKNKFKLTQNVFSKFPKDHDSVSFQTYVENNFQFTNDKVENEKIEYFIKLRKLRHEQFMIFLKTGSGVKLKPDFDKINKAIVMLNILATTQGD